MPLHESNVLALVERVLMSSKHEELNIRQTLIFDNLENNYAREVYQTNRPGTVFPPKKLRPLPCDVSTINTVS